MKDEEKMYGRLLPLKTGAEYLGVSLETLRKWVQDGKVESHKLWGRRLISEDEVIRLIELSRVRKSVSHRALPDPAL